MRRYEHAWSCHTFATIQMSLPAKWLFPILILLREIEIPMKTSNPCRASVMWSSREVTPRRPDALTGWHWPTNCVFYAAPDVSAKCHYHLCCIFSNRQKLYCSTKFLAGICFVLFLCNCYQINYFTNHILIIPMYKYKSVEKRSTQNVDL